jgi:hypothetical protein
MILKSHTLSRMSDTTETRNPCVIICERQRTLYGIKCVLRIFWQTWLYILTNKKEFDVLYTPIPCNTLTHSTNEDLRNIKRKGDPEVSYPLSYVRYHWNPEPVCNKSHFVSLFYLYWYFLIYLISSDILTRIFVSMRKLTFEIS